jgi:hypothetical protein
MAAARVARARIQQVRVGAEEESYQVHHDSMALPRTFPRRVRPGDDVRIGRIGVS